MKVFLKKLAAAAAALLLLGAPIRAMASEAMGEDLTGENVVLHQGTTFTENVFWSDSAGALRTEHFVTYTPGDAVKPVVTFGSAMTERLSVARAAAQLESAGSRVVAGVNGDFFNVGNGLPVGIVVTEGLLRSSDAGYCAVGFRSDGTAFIGRPQVRLQAALGYGVETNGVYTEYVRPLSALNKARVTNGGIFLYTGDFNTRHTTGVTEPGVEALCRVTEGELRIGGTLRAVVEQVTEGSAATVMEPDQVVLSVNLQANSYYVDAIRNLPVGTEVTITAQAADDAWNEIDYAVGGLYPLLEDGAVITASAAGQEPRTAIGVKDDGTVVFYTLDGRSGSAAGASMAGVARRLLELGCTDAVCLDGGGSTTLVATKPNAAAAAVVNRPSEGYGRAVTDQVFLVADNTPSGVADHLFIEPAQRWVLAGTKVSIDASAVDTNYIPMGGASLTLSASAGTLEGSVLTTPAEGGEVTVSVTDGRRRAETVLHAVSAPDTLQVKAGGTAVSKLSVQPGSRTALKAELFWNHLPLAADDALVRWEFTGGCARLEGATLAAVAPGEGTLAVTAGQTRREIPVTVTALPLKTVEDFESEIDLLPGEDSFGLELTRTADPALVRFGRYSAAARYLLSEENGFAAEWTASDGRTWAVERAVYPTLNLWLYGDGSGNELELLCTDGKALPAVKLDFTGWRQVTLTLPESPCALRGVRISTPEGADSAAASAGTPREGTVYLDQLVAAFPGTVDTVPPAVTLNGGSGDAGSITGTVRDAVDGILPRAALSVTLDGNDCSFTYDARTGTVTVAAAGDGAPHRLTVTAKDASGNIGRASRDLPVVLVSHCFTDIDGYWAADYADYLFFAGITTGYSDGTFRPNQSITRAQFAAMLFRYLGLDAGQWESAPLPFADADAVPAYARAAVAALSSMGVINGSAGKDGRLVFNPGGLLTRAQAAAMIGRTQEKGYAESALTFSDAGQIPAYAAPYIRTMAAQGVIGGYGDGTFRPQQNITRGQMAKILYTLM